MKKSKNKSNIQIVKDMLNGERPFSQFGYEGEKEKPHSQRNVGEIWEDSKGKKWIKLESGAVRTYNPQAEIIKAEINKKWVCKRCSSDLRWSPNSKTEEKFLNKTGMCMKCVSEYETELRVSGHFKDYEKKKVLNNQLSYATDMKQKLKEAYKHVSENDKIEYVNSNGMVEEWIDIPRDQIMKDIRVDYKSCVRSIYLIKKELGSIPNIPEPSEINRINFDATDMLCQTLI